MGLFKEIFCSECNRKTHLLTRTRLCDENYLCYDCSSIIPSFMKKSFLEKYTLEDYHSFKEYIKYSDEYLRPKFHETHSFHSLHIDAENLLFYIGYGINSNTIFLKFQNITRFNMLFQAEKYKEGIIGSTVNGKIIYELGMDHPRFYFDEVLTNSAKAKAKKTFFGNSIEYDNPSDMTDFLFHFNRIWEISLDEYEFYDACSSEGNSNLSDLQQSMALFMIDSLDEITPEKLKSLRNKLIITFHPDKGDDNTKHAQKINAAYDIIKNALK